MPDGHVIMSDGHWFFRGELKTTNDIQIIFNVITDT